MDGVYALGIQLVFGCFVFWVRRKYFKLVMNIVCCLSTIACSLNENKGETMFFWMAVLGLGGIPLTFMSLYDFCVWRLESKKSRF